MSAVNRRQALSTFGAGLAIWSLSGLKAFAESLELKFRDLYSRGTKFSERTQSLKGETVQVFGFMAPPLKAESNFFVLTKMPMSTCPFCESEAEWPDDLIVAYTDELISAVPYNYPIIVTGKLDLGTYKDEEIGFVSRVRLMSAEVARVS